MKKITLVSICLLAVLFTGGCATDSGGKADKKELPGEKFTRVISLRPASFTEKCVRLRPEQAMEYTFTSTGNVYFNIHNHGKKGRTYVVQKESISAWKGTVVPAELGEDYDKYRPGFCMLWRNKSDRRVRINLEYTVTGG